MAGSMGQRSERPNVARASATYARFWRCALQVNPFRYAGTYRGDDHGLSEEAYNEALRDQCLKLDIRVVGVANHGSVEGIDRLRGCLEPHGIVVFPGFEVASTEKVHMVCLFPEGTSEKALDRYLGRLEILDIENGVWPSGLGCVEIAKRVEEQGGFWYAAHATGNNGLLRLNQDGGGLTHVWKDCDRVRVAQIPGPVQDLPSTYRKIIANKDPAYARARPIVLIHAKDIAGPEELADPSATCFVKMTRPSFEAFKVAFLDPDSRIRLSSALPSEGHSALRSMRIRGGYLDGLRIDLSDHLNTVIGGRGTGKSTLIECLRYVLAIEPKGKQALRLHRDIIQANLGSSSGSVELTLRSAAQHGRIFTVTRRFAEPPIVRDETGEVSQQTPADLLPTIEIYGQNEIYELAQEEGRVRLLDRFLPTDDAGERRRTELRAHLSENRRRLLKALADLDEAEEHVAKLPKLSEQLEGFRRLGVEAKLANAPLFTRERQLVERVHQEIAGVEAALEALEEGLPDLAFLGDKSLENLPHAAGLRPIRATVESLRAAVEMHLNALRAATAESRSALAPLVAIWRSALEASEAELERTLAQLPDMAGKSGREVGTAYRRLTQEIERIRPLEARLTTLRQLCDALVRERTSYLAQLSELRSERAAAFARAIRRLNARLTGTIQIELRSESDRSGLKAFLKASNLDGVGEKRLAWVEERDDVTPLGLAAAIRGGQEALRSTFDVTPSVAEALAKLSRERLLELEELELGTCVDIRLNVAHQGEPVYKSLDKLSTGQQCTAVLHMVLLDNADPLVVDQPEDNLDNAFIADRIVRELRRAKTERQFFFSTHNANIPIFGDAEWIGIVTATEDHGGIEREDQGSIDVNEIRDQAAEILDGGREAFTQRREKYGF